MTTSSDPRDALVQVRTAYRLLNAYHRRLLDLAALTRDAVQQRCGGLQKGSWGRRQFRWPPVGQSDPTSRSAYEFIPLQDAYFQWRSAGDLSAGGFHFGLGHTPDSAIGALDVSRLKYEPDTLALSPVQDASTRVDIWVAAVAPCRLTWEQLGNIDADERIDAASWDDRVLRKLDVDGTPVAYGGFSLDVADIWTADATKSRLIEPLVKLIEDLKAFAEGSP